MSTEIDSLIADSSLTPLLNTSRDTLQATLELLHFLSQPDTIPTSSSQSLSLETQLLISRYHKNINASLSILRGQNRNAILDVRRTKEETAKARTEVDRLHLQLQNLYYEQRYLVGEIRGCEGYDHAYAALPLISLEEFLSLFPEHTELPETELMPLRIQHEEAERKKLETERQELVKKKLELQKENSKRKEDLRKLDERLEKFLEGARGIEEVLEGMKF
ncbi:MAG: hypothetical protein Q9160_008735 [Pyrenula sp. 1 TL-2023]